MANLSDVLVQYRIHGGNVSCRYASTRLRLDEEIAASQAERLFPGLPAAEALILRRKLMRDSQEPVSWSDLALHRRAAQLPHSGCPGPARRRSAGLRAGAVPFTAQAC